MAALKLALSPGDEVARADLAGQLVAYLDFYEFEPEAQGWQRSCSVCSFSPPADRLVPAIWIHRRLCRARPAALR
jgi:hypothetical protein